MPKTAPNVFVNCAFDADFAESFRAIVFAVIACGFIVRCAREMDDASETRIDKLYRIIEESRFGIHDLSRTELDSVHGLPRFNMPLELGMFLAAKRFGDEEQKLKRCLVMDIERYRFQRFVSDLAGMDIQPHDSEPRQMVGRVRDWLVAVSRQRKIPTTAAILESYDLFVEALPQIARNAGFQMADLSYPDFERLTLSWVRRRRR
ncbi:hypothetical protein [Sphingomonas sp. PB4P5]|uniref:hypothetical protein n=1 Tax=Parasphingomonas puruogangriensis TaxID=3096155 RepID=UPI002FC9E7FE